MGVVYRARDNERKIDVALKSLQRAEPKALYRFKREFRTLADVVHPNLVTLYELHTAGDEWFFTMELVEGVPFVAWVRPRRARPGDGSSDALEHTATTTTDPTIALEDTPGRPSSPAPPVKRGREHIVAGVVDYARLGDALYQLVDAVLALHRVGKLHRDLKPTNVLVESDGRVVVLDFGLAGDKASLDEDRTHDLAAVGTPMYMSPEQAADDPLTEASDWYSVGVMLYEALTGYRPFEETGREVEVAKQALEPPRPRALAPDVPRALDELCLRLLARDPRDRPGGEEILEALGRSPSEATRQLALARREPPFVGRERELGALRDAFAATRAGTGTTVFVRGPSGIGKSTLVRRFLAEARDHHDAIVLAGRCYERESVPYKALDSLVDALTRALLRMDRDEVAAALPRDIMTLARLFSVLKRVPAIRAPAQRRLVPADQQELRRRGFSALRHLLAEIAARHPVVLFIDDLQWGDTDSATFLVELVTRTPPLLLVLGYRVEDEERSALVAAVRRHAAPGAGACREVDVGTLPHDDARALLRGMRGVVFGEDDDELVRDSGGSPLFLVELARADPAQARAEGPRTLDDLLRERIERLPARERRLLVACAAAGRPLAQDLVVRASGLDGAGPEPEVLRAERLVRTRVTASGTAQLEPYHDRVRAAALSFVDVDERASLHRALAEAMEEGGVDDAEALVEHWLGAGDTARAGRYAASAATAAEKAVAFHSAARYYALALDHLDLGDDERRAMRVRLGHALANAGRLDEAATVFGVAAQGAGREQGIELRRLELEQLLRSGRLEEGLARAREVLASVGLSFPTSERGALLAVLRSRIALSVRGFGFRARDAADIDDERLRRIDVCWSVASALSFVNPIVGRALQMRYVRLALATGEPSRVALALSMELGYRGVYGEGGRERLEAIYERARDLVVDLHDERLIGLIEGAGGLASFLCGRWREASERIRRCLRLLRDHASDARWEIDIAEIFLTGTLTYLGGLRELVTLVPIFLREAEERGDVYAARGLRGWRSNLTWLILDRPDEARAHLAAVAATGKFHLYHFYELLSRAHIDFYEGGGARTWETICTADRDVRRALLLRIQTMRIEWFYVRARAALASLDHGDRDAKLRAAARDARRLAREDAAWAAPIAALIRARVAAARGDVEDSARLLRTAASAFDACDMALHTAVAHARLGALLGGDEGDSLSRAATAWMEGEDVVAPDRLIRVFAP